MERSATTSSFVHLCLSTAGRILQSLSRPRSRRGTWTPAVALPIAYAWFRGCVDIHLTSNLRAQRQSITHDEHL